MTTPALIPTPRTVNWLEGRFPVGENLWRVHPEALIDESITNLLETYKAHYRPDKTLPPNTVAVGTEPDMGAERPRGDEGYVLNVSERGLLCHGATETGLFRGLTTVMQLLEQVPALPACRIVDWPEIALRGHFDDISRKQISTLQDFRRIIRYLSRYKVNAYCLYLEDVFHFRSYPDIGRGRGKLLPYEVEQIVAEGKRYKVDIIPAFQLLGHHENLLAQDSYRKLGREVFQALSTLDPTKPEVRELLANCIREICEAFPSEYFCMGFDETQGIDRETYVQHANWCAEQIVTHGKKPIFWADMLYNHFGYETLEQMHESLIPANWNYGVVGEEIPHQKELEARGRPVWGFGGYRNWAKFLPEFETSKDHIQTWAGYLQGKENRALLCCQWGDEGYENSRDLCWNLYAFFGECCWSGPEAQRESFETRFETGFYGKELPAVKEIVSTLPGKLSFDSHWYWLMHRKNVWSLFRHAAAHPEWQTQLQDDQRKLENALNELARDCPQASREQAHLDHFAVSLQRTLGIVDRVLFALRYAGKTQWEACEQEAQQLAAQLRWTRDRYAEVWLRHNKRENIDTSLRVFGEMATGYEELVRADVPPPLHERYMPVDLSSQWNARFLDIGGVPVGRGVFHGIPFDFADIEHTHLRLAASKEPMVVRFEPAVVTDIHLVVAAPLPEDRKPRPALKVELLRGQTTVHSSELDLITDLCDWWAPLGEHIWAGGGYRHANHHRVHYLLKPDHLYGLCRVSEFPIASATEADTLKLTLLIEHEVEVFAATLERGQ